MTYQHIFYGMEQMIATITLNRPDRMNAWTPIMVRDVRDAMAAAAKDDGVRFQGRRGKLCGKAAAETYGG